MKRIWLAFLTLAVLSAVCPTWSSAQLTEDVLQARIEAAETDPSATTIYQAARAARLLRDFDTAESFLNKAAETEGLSRQMVLLERLFFEFASGGGVLESGSWIELVGSKGTLYGMAVSQGIVLDG
jgi:uncharacterized protein HemY